MIRILGLDQSLTRTGWAIAEKPARGEVTVGPTGWFAAPGSTARFGKELWGLLLDLSPDFIVFEKPRTVVMTYAKKPGLIPGENFVTPNASQLVLPWIAGMIEQACIDRQMPYEIVSAPTWRARMIGKGAGHLSRKEAKEAARKTCDWLGLRYPNEDVAEAILIALYGAASDTVRMMLHRGEAA